MKTVYDPAAIPAVDSYKLLTGLVTPRPIAWVGSMDGAGVANLAPFSFFNAVATSPPTIMFSTGRPRGRVKDTLANVRRTGEFTVSMVSEFLLDPMNASSGSFPPEVDEFASCGLTARMGDAVAAPMVAEARAALECRVIETVDVGRAPSPATVVFGEVVLFHVDNDILDGTRVDPLGLAAVGRLGGPQYALLREVVTRERPA
jgi:flavin reductase (DIM6/NTAB) family NADH-FMN oxidoreductase RutF